MSRGVYFDPGSTRQNRQRDGLYYKARFYSIFLCFLAFLLVFSLNCVALSTLSRVKVDTSKNFKIGFEHTVNMVMRRRTTEATGHIVPEQIRLPDGREIPTQDIREQVTNRVNYNLRTGTAYTYRGKFKFAKPVDTESES